METSLGSRTTHPLDCNSQSFGYSQRTSGHGQTLWWVRSTIVIRLLLWLDFLWRQWGQDAEYRCSSGWLAPSHSPVCFAWCTSQCNRVKSYVSSYEWVSSCAALGDVREFPSRCIPRHTVSRHHVDLLPLSSLSAGDVLWPWQPVYNQSQLGDFFRRSPSYSPMAPGDSTSAPTIHRGV